MAARSEFHDGHLMRISPPRIGDQPFAAGTLFTCEAIASATNAPPWPQK